VLRRDVQKLDLLEDLGALFALVAPGVIVALLDVEGGQGRLEPVPVRGELPDQVVDRP
jgi:hypothetical protein